MNPDEGSMQALAKFGAGNLTVEDLLFDCLAQKNSDELSNQSSLHPSSLRAAAIEDAGVTITPSQAHNASLSELIAAGFLPGYKPRSKVPLTADEKKERNKEVQKRYRQKAKQRSQEILATLDAMEAEEDALIKEQDDLIVCMRGLELLCHMSAIVIGVLGSNVEAIGASSPSVVTPSGDSPQTPGNALSASLDDQIWKHGHRPSDSQLFALARDLPEISVADQDFVTRLTNLVSDWGEATPAGRKQLERTLDIVFETRQRLLTILINAFPNKAHGMVAPADFNRPDPEPLEMHMVRKTCLMHPELVESTALSDDQKMSLMRQYQDYSKVHESTKFFAAKHAHEIQKCLTYITEGTEGPDPIRSMAHAGKAHVALGRTVKELEKAKKAELESRLRLLRGACVVLRPLQHAVAILDALPHVDIVGMYQSILQLEHESAPSVTPQHYTASQSQFTLSSEPSGLSVPFYY